MGITLLPSQWTCLSQHGPDRELPDATKVYCVLLYEGVVREGLRMCHFPRRAEAVSNVGVASIAPQMYTD